MNKIYRLVFNKSTGLIQVASELASSAGGSVSSRLVNTIVFSESFALIPFRLRTLTAALVSTLLMSGPLLLGRGIASAANCASTISSSSSACTLSTNSVEITGSGSIVSSSIPIGVSSSSTGLNLGGITVDSGGLLQYTGSTGTSAGISYVYNPTGAPSPRNYAGAINLNGDLTSSQRGIYVNGFVLDSVSIGSGSTLTAGGFGMFLADSSGVTGNVTNNGTISSGSYSISIGGASSGVVASYIEGGITNYGTITSSNGVAINNAGDITGAITNSATGILNGAINISGTATGGIDNFGIINHTNNPDSYAINITGSVGGGITNESSGVINGTVYANTVTALTLDNSGQINGPVTFNATPGTINLNGAAGTITGAVTGSNTTVNAVGTFSTANTFNVKTFNVNAGGSLTLNDDVTLVTGNTFTNAGNLTVVAAKSPTITGNYAQSGTYTLEIASTTSYSILNITGGASFSGAYDFTLLPSSTLVADNLYQGILRSNSLAGFTTQTYTQSLGGTSYTYQVLQDATNAGWLDLCYSPIAGSCTGGSGKPDIVVAGNSDGTNIASSIVSGVSPNFNNRFDGGTLLVDVANTYGGNFTITTNGGLINANGLASTFTGVFSDDASGVPGSLSITNSAASNGTVTLTGTNTYTGTTTIDTGATLALSGTGSIATSRGVVDNGSFDIS
ncbi:ESPR domain-containing protein, partial [Polynucleobacter sp. P1-05-14]|uniref:ESPR domain-containing protein n=1 Tax=Polynucleobacter sp. P1-05-14 TaxID=1819732 RepID=UPI001C0D9F54